MAGSKLRVALLAGGVSAEREVSLKSAQQVLHALDKEKYEVFRYDPREDLPRLVQDASRIDVALIILHGRLGEDGTIQGFLESLGIPYQGSGVLGSAVAMNKIVSKRLYEQAGISVAPYVVIDRRDPSACERIVQELGLPVVIKPEHEGSSIGLSIVRHEKDLPQALDKAWAYDRRCLVEKYIPGIEVTGGVLGNDDLQALPLVEIVPGNQYEFFNYEAKYTPGASKEICPARLSPPLTQRAQELALRAHRALCCRGYSRTDMMVHVETEEIYVLETNTIPGMTPTSLFPQAAAAAGLSFSQLLDRLIDLALEDRR
ncbi:MAG: D-alanine--D-alanine ligase family protein [Desulfosoma sp.]|uniref:D-alanine--D-alanine ligase family protein n=1 Tax=Desulfosoma sp. TaxID=2603217 RepID=UPI0040490E30